MSINYDLKKAQENAKKIGFTVKPSTRKSKKLDVYKDEKKIASIGDPRYADFTKHGDEKRRERYHSRFKRCIDVKDSPCYLSYYILWT